MLLLKKNLCNPPGCIRFDLLSPGTEQHHQLQFPWPHNYWMEISLISLRLMRYWNNCESKDALNNNNQRFWKMFLALLMKDSKYLRILQMNLLNSCEGLLRSNGWAFMLCVCVAIAFRNMIIGMSTWVKTTVPFGFCWSWLHSCKQSVE